LNLSEDPFVRELLPEFIDTWLDDLNNQFDSLLTEKKADELYRMAHTLKGSCYQFGLNEIGDMGIQLMGYAKEHNWDKAAEMKPVILGNFEKLKQNLSVIDIKEG